MKTLLAACFAIAMIAAGCASSSPKPTSQLVEANAAVRGAEELGAQSHPKSKLYVKLAREAIASAETAMANDDNDNARQLLERARVDAELAVLYTRSAKRRAEAKQAMNRVEALERGDSTP